MGATGTRERRLVRVWFGEHVISQQIADPALATRFERAMRRRFPESQGDERPLAVGSTGNTVGREQVRMTEPADIRRPGAYDATRPLVLGYLRASLCGSDQELAAAREQLAVVAQMEGYTLGAVFTEQPDTAPAAFSALVDAVKHYEAKGIVVPSAEHLAVLGGGQALGDYLQRVTGVPLIVVQVPEAAPTTPEEPPTSTGSTRPEPEPDPPARPTSPETPWLFLPP